MFDWDDIRLFLAVSRTGTVRGAAQKLGLTHATVSRRLHQLEEKLGAQLFDRTSTKHVLTATGHRVLEDAIEAESHMAAIDRTAFAQDRRLAGKIRLSMLESLYLAVLAPALPRFFEHHPLIEIDLITTDLISNLAQREADIVIRITRTPPETALGRKLADSPLKVYGAPAYLENRPELDRWIALTHEPARIPPMPARTILTANSLITAQGLIEAGSGLGKLPCFLGDGNPKLTALSEYELEPDMEIWGLMHPDLKDSPKVRALMDFIYEVFDKERARIDGSAFQTL